MLLLDFIISLFTEKKCFNCQQLWHFFCPKCNMDLVEYSPYCYVCKKYSKDFSVHKACQEYFLIDQVIVLTRYRNKGIKKLLRHAKYYNKYRAYEDIIVSHTDFFNNFITHDTALLVPVPMHYLRKWKRWYNQSEIIAQKLWNISKVPVNNRFIKRVRSTKQQSHLSQSERIHNLDNAFQLWKEKIDSNTTIYLVDDVVSTGSTLNEIAKFLQSKWYKNIRAIVLASD